ncbi:MAG TPA: response regulator transcription factor [Opitutaceae bacterium]|nr:response regulator transcription factor [Opitutaceae bacterium]
MKILAVEDDPVAQLVLEAELKSLGHEVVLAANGEDAWDALRELALRVVVSDWRMPATDGLELCRRVRARGGDYVCFILLTQLSATDENVDAALAAGVDDFLTKPVDVRELKMRLHVAQRLVGLTSQVRQLESFLPICGYCKKIRDDRNYWQQLESYFSERMGTAFSHGVCPECHERHVVPMLRAAKEEAARQPPRAKRVD